MFVAPASAQQATITDRSLKLSDSRPAVTATYEVAFTAPPVLLMGSIKIEFCENTPLFSEICVPPVGFDVSSAVLSDQTGNTGFSIHPSSTDSVIILRRPPIASLGAPSTYTFTGVRSADNDGTQYVRYSTHAEEDATGPMLDLGGIAYHLNGTLGLSTEVPPNLSFCLAVTITGLDCLTATGNYVQLGELVTTNPRTGKIEMVIGTNAANGYSIAISGKTMTSGNNTIAALATPTPSAPGNSQFGINLRANSNPGSGAEPSGPGSSMPTGDYNIPNRFTFVPGAVIVSHGGPDDFRKFTATYLVNISRTQPPGVYNGTYTYLAIGNF